MQIGKLSHRISQINKRHRAGLNFQKQQSTVTLLLHGKSIVQHKKQYIVEKISMPDSCFCKSRCATCNACVHAYSLAPAWTTLFMLQYASIDMLCT